MAYYTLHAYDADVWIPHFAGLRQSDEVATDLRYAFMAENVETPRGVLQPMAAPEFVGPTFGHRIETMATFHRRWYVEDDDKDWLIIAINGKLWYKHDVPEEIWLPLPYPTGIDKWQCNVWSYVTYEINPVGADSSVDVLLMSNALDGLIMITPPYVKNGSTYIDWSVTQIKLDGNILPFGVIERYAERIWGGALPDDPDTLMYSRPYDPTNWTGPGADEEPEDGAGSIKQPSWDGDSFTALKAFGSQLIAFKKNRVWRILGTNPGEYTFKEQYGGGTAYPHTVVVDVERILMMETDGMSVYDGLSVTEFNRTAIERIWKTVNKGALDQMCGCLFKNRYYVAFPTGTSTVNNTLIVYNMEEGTFLLYTDIYIESLMATQGTLYATNSTVPGRIMVINYDSWETGKASGKLCRWETPWLDFGRKSIAKGGYEIYFSPEVKGHPVTFRFSIQTEKKTKSKTVTVGTTSFKAKQKRVRFGGTSRRFKLIVETLPEPIGATWRLLGGIQMVVEIDPD